MEVHASLEAGMSFAIRGEHDANTIAQMQECMRHDAVAGVLCADGHKGYAQPVGGVTAYRGKVSISGVGFDIACGNMAVKLSVTHDDIKDRLADIGGEIAKQVSFGIGRRNATRVEHALFDDDPAWEIPEIRSLKDMARGQLGTVGSGNHYVDVFRDEDGFVWIGVHFGSRGLGHKTTTHYLKAAGGRDGMDVAPTVLDEHSDLGEQYIRGMRLAGRYAYAGREWVVDTVRRIIGGEVLDSVHNHHNFCVAGDQIVQTLLGPKRMEHVTEGDIIYAFDTKAGLVPTKVLKQWQSGTKEIVRIATASRSIRVSADHPVQVVNLVVQDHPDRPWHSKTEGVLAWKKAGDIRLGDLVVCAENFYDDSCNIENAEAVFRFVGAFLGDGWIRKEPKVSGYGVGLAIGSTDDLHTQDYLALVQELFPSVNWKNNGAGAFGLTCSSRTVHDYVRQMGIGGKSHDKAVPNVAFSLPANVKLALLAGYMDADGSVANEKTNNHGRGTIASVNETLVRHLREIALSCGLRVTTIKKEKRNTNYGKCVVFRCVIAAASMSQIPLWHREKSSNVRHDAKDCAGLQPSKIGYVDLPAGILVQSVRSLKAEPEEAVYDLTVEHESHSFLCEGVVVHNCWQEEHGGEKLWVVRKGATPAFPGQRGFVGGSMGDVSVILRGKPAGNAGPELLFSTVHGAGRTMSRTQAAGKKKWNKSRKRWEISSPGLVDESRMRRDMAAKGVILIGGGADEAPQVYKPLRTVLDYHSDTIEIEHTLTPLIVAMAGNDIFDPFKD
jgi:RNA-splicing ligase RtcB/intein/homing endonuclease